MTLDEGIRSYSEKAERYSILAISEKDKKVAQNYKNIAEWLKELKELKEKNEPKYVNYYGDGEWDGDIVYDGAECPSCGRDFEEDDECWEMPYCPECGQRLEWEDEENNPCIH